VAGASATPFTVQITTVAGAAFAPAAITLHGNPPRSKGIAPLLALGIFVSAVFLAILTSRQLRSAKRRPVFAGITATILVVVLAALLASCGMGGGGSATSDPQTDTPIGTYTLTVNATAQSVTRSVQLTLAVQ
jgi:peptidoglycan biosynthesis protein MviN/MurJ (putative lipid II flippase)